MQRASRPRHVREPGEKLARLIVSATEVFGKDGYARARVQDICGNAGVSVGTFYEHFENKAGLLLHIAEVEAEHLRPPGSASIEELEHAIGQFVGSPLAGIARAWLQAVELEPQLRTAHARLQRANLDRYTEWVREARERRRRVSPIDDRATARAIIALLKDEIRARYEPAVPRTADLAQATWYLLFGE